MNPSRDRWLTETPLIDLVTSPISPSELDLCVRDLWSVYSGWDTQRIRSHVPENVWLHLLTVVVDQFTGAADRISWTGSQNGRFSVRSAYTVFTRSLYHRSNMGKFYKFVWSCMVPERVKVFLWLIANQAIMTNEECVRRHLSESSLCQVCRGANESILHILRDCPATEGIWLRLVPVREHNNFFTMTLYEWLYTNLRNMRMVDDCPWATLFGITIWWSWKWRCYNVFGSNVTCRDRVKFIKGYGQEVMRAHIQVNIHQQRPARMERLICWVKPQDQWLKLNTDGSSRGNPGLAATGGVLRDSQGVWRKGFSLNIGICTAPLAELWGVYYGLYIAWEERVNRLELEIDSELVVSFLQTGIEDTHPLSFLVRLCHGFISRDWIVRITHVYREANHLVDGLANYAYILPLGFHSFAEPSDVIRSFVMDDINGVASLRNICV